MSSSSDGAGSTSCEIEANRSQRHLNGFAATLRGTFCVFELDAGTVSPGPKGEVRPSVENRFNESVCVYAYIRDRGSDTH